MPIALDDTKKSRGDNGSTAKPDFATAVDSVPVTQQRPVHIPSSDSQLAYPGVPRANLAATTDSPQGTQQNGHAAKHADQTVLQQHCAYWDRDGDGVIWPWDTYSGVRAWGWMIPLALLATGIIHGALSYLTGASVLPDPFFRIYLARIHKDKHGSDSGTYDTEGRFRAQNFEEIFSKYDRGDKGGLDKGDVVRMLQGQRVAVDPFGWSAAILECEWLTFCFLLSLRRCCELEERFG